jgi:hypothetical protein
MKAYFHKGAFVMRHKKLIRLMHILVVALISFARQPSGFAAETSAPVQLDQPLHLMNADGTDYFASAGMYRLSVRQNHGLELTAPSGARTALATAESSHTHTLNDPVALVIPEGEDLVHLVLALPNGGALETVGSLSGVRARGPGSPLGSARINQALNNSPVASIQSAPTVTLSPPQGPPGTMVNITVSNFPRPPQQFPQLREAEIKLDNVPIQRVTLLPCSNGTLGLGEDCGTPPLMVRIEGAPGSKKSISVETSKNILLGSPSASALFTVHIAPLGQTPTTAPPLIIEPTSGPPGTIVDVRACGFPTTFEHKEARIFVEGQVVGTVRIGRCSDLSAGFGRDVALPNGFFDAASFVVDAPPGPKTIQVQVVAGSSNPGPHSTATFTTTASPPVSISPRFQLLLGGLAVLDKETGLTWERIPSKIANQKSSFQTARLECHRRMHANQIGWRLPSLDELASLIDTGRRSPALPAGHPFSLPSGGMPVWTTTVDLDNPQVVYSVDIEYGNIRWLPKDTSAAFLAWCVKGIPGPEKQ